MKFPGQSSKKGTASHPSSSLRGLVVSLLILGGAALATAQTPPPPIATPRPAASGTPANGEITGTVLADDGQPLPDAQIAVTSTGGTDGLFAPPKSVNAQPNGRFRITGLRAGVYYLTAGSPGYVMPDRDDPRGRPLPYRVGANATLMLSKGGVITGTVSDVTGEPLVGVYVTAVRVRDSFGRKPPPALAQPEGYTDDRGIYRIYGLTPGAYLVAAGGVTGSGTYEISRGTLNAAPVYYPSSSAEAAVKVEVGLGQESSGIDIRVRGDAGHDVSGTLVGVSSGPDGKTMGIAVVLQRANNGAQLGATFVQEQNGQIQFAFSQVPDGEYELIAETWQREGGAGSMPQRITVKGADLANVRLNLAAFGSIGGRLVLEADATLRERAECAATGRPATVEEFSFELRRTKFVEAFGFDAWTNRGGAVPDEKGNFLSAGMRAGTYWPQLDFPDDRHYLRSVTRSGPAGKPVNALGNGLVLGGGEKITGLTVTISDGAAGLKGRLALPEAKPGSTGASPTLPGATPNASPALPPNTLVHLIPAEPTAADDILRYREIEVGADGAFALANLAPGKYWLYAEVLPFGYRAGEAQLGGTPPGSFARTNPPEVRAPGAWDAATRLKLRRAAEAANVSLELQPCQRVTDYVFRFNPASTK